MIFCCFYVFYAPERFSNSSGSFLSFVGFWGDSATRNPCRNSYYVGPLIVLSREDSDLIFKGRCFCSFCFSFVFLLFFAMTQRREAPHHRGPQLFSMINWVYLIFLRKFKSNNQYSGNPFNS